MALTPQRTRELTERIIRDDHGVVPALIELLHGIRDPNGDPVRYGLADREMQYLVGAFTEDGERTYREHVERLDMPFDQTSEASS